MSKPNLFAVLSELKDASREVITAYDCTELSNQNMLKLKEKTKQASEILIDMLFPINGKEQMNALLIAFGYPMLPEEQPTNSTLIPKIRRLS